ITMIIRGPFDIKWGDNTIEDVEDVSLDISIDSEDYQTVQGRTLEIDGSYKATGILTLLASDIPALAALLPQYFVQNGGILSTGETVNNADGAIDMKPASCDDSIVYNNLDFISCGNPGQVTRITNARTKIDSVELDNKVQKVMIKFIGEALPSEAVVQFFREGTIHVVS
ncbi:MAG: hypothetical protein ACEQR7_10290, partial [Agathobacter rectalis]